MLGNIVVVHGCSVNNTNSAVVGKFQNAGTRMYSNLAGYTAKSWLIGAIKRGHYSVSDEMISKMFCSG